MSAANRNQNRLVRSISLYRLSSVTRIVVIIGLILQLISGVQCDIRCHCNQPVCVRTGYMCKSKGPQAGCFVEHSGYVNVDRSSDISRHGCIEMLPAEERAPCLELALALAASNSLSGNAVRSVHHRHSGWRQSGSMGHHHLHGLRTRNKTCCLDDMCNYVKTIVEDSIDSNQYHQTNDNSAQSSHHLERDATSSFSAGSSYHSSKDFDTLGKRLQETYGIEDPLEQDGYSHSFALVISAILIFLFMVLIMLIICAVRFIKQEEVKLTSVTQLTGRNQDKMSPHKKSSMLDWRYLMSPKRATTCPSHLSSKQQQQKMLQQQANQRKNHSLLVNVQVDVNGVMDHMTKLDKCVEKPISNLPNIISVHSLPIDSGKSVANSSDEEDNSKGLPLGVGAGVVGRERQNSIYMSLLSAQANHNQSTTGLHTRQSPVPSANFDLISSSTDHANVV